MAFIKNIIAIVAIAGLTVAAPGSSDGPTGAEIQAQQCGNGQHLRCCTNESEDEAGLIGSALDSLQCLQIPVLAIPINKACGNQNVACCSGDQTGLVNVQCSPINVL